MFLFTQMFLCCRPHSVVYFSYSVCFIDLSISLYKKSNSFSFLLQDIIPLWVNATIIFSDRGNTRLFSGYRKQHSGERSCCFLVVLGLVSEFLPDKRRSMKLLPATPSAHSDPRCDSAVCSPSRVN